MLSIILTLVLLYGSYVKLGSPISVSVKPRNVLAVPPLPSGYSTLNSANVEPDATGLSKIFCATSLLVSSVFALSTNPLRGSLAPSSY